MKNAQQPAQQPPKNNLAARMPTSDSTNSMKLTLFRRNTDPKPLRPVSRLRALFEGIIYSPDHETNKRIKELRNDLTAIEVLNESRLAALKKGHVEREAELSAKIDLLEAQKKDLERKGVDKDCIIALQKNLLESQRASADGKAPGTAQPKQESEAPKKIDEKLAAEIVSFLSQEVHDLRSPLTAIQSTAQALESYIEDAGLKKLARMIIRNSEKMRLLIANILEYDKLSKGDVKLQKVPYDLSEQLRQLVEDHHRRASEMNKDIAFECDAGVIVNGDALHLERVFGNLLDNALRHGVQVKVSVRRNCTKAIIRISDNGKRIDSSVISKLFKEKFTTNPLGNGYGLRNSKRLTEMHEGSIDFESEPGKGSTFTVLLPMVK